MAVNLKTIYLLIFQLSLIIMRQLWFYFLTTMTVVAVVSSTEEVLDNTAAQNQNWNWIIKDPKPLPFGASGVGLNAKL